MSLKFQRLILVIISLTMIIAAIGLIIYNTQENISYFYTPSELRSSDVSTKKQIRIGGLVKKNSFIKVTGSSFEFIITDNKNSIFVTYNGILPDLFREGQGAVIEGFLEKDVIPSTANLIIFVIGYLLFPEKRFSRM